MKPIPYGRQQITEEDINAVVRVLKSDFLTQGPEIREFENAFASYVGAKFAVAVSNGTAALHLSALALDVKPGDKVITTPNTFAASANCIRFCGGEVVFSDIDPENYCLDIQKVEQLLERSPQGTYKGIIPVDFAGFPVDMEGFRRLADQHGLWIIEDACHAPGGYFHDSNGSKQLCGNGKFADLTVFSFHPVKHIACGEGGMVTTNNEKLYQKLLMLRTHGITKDAQAFQNSIEAAYGLQLETLNFATKGSPDSSGEPETFPGWYYEMQELGFNYRLTDFQAALGNSQLKKAAKGIQRRKEIAEKYDNAFRDVDGIKLPNCNNKVSHAWHLYVIQVEDRAGLYDWLRGNQIDTQIHYIPLHTMPYYRSFGWQKGQMPIAEAYYEKCLSLPIFSSLTDDEQNYVIEKVKNHKK